MLQVTVSLADPARSVMVPAADMSSLNPKEPCLVAGSLARVQYNTALLRCSCKCS